MPDVSLSKSSKRPGRDHKELTEEIVRELLYICSRQSTNGLSLLVLSWVVWENGDLSKLQRSCSNLLTKGQSAAYNPEQRFKAEFAIYQD